MKIELECPNCQRPGYIERCERACSVDLTELHTLAQAHLLPIYL